MYLIALFKDEWGFLLVVKMVELNAALKNAAELYLIGDDYGITRYFIRKIRT
ncbi:TPA: hypothetical protein ACY37F_001009 [Pasteurella multocida]|uniref:hypothetical protein n=1 Tax=Pasteurella multocida TaxID=747 RepID=UPI000353C745|nr:hypothetical protein [Pasteurella multocida]ESQ72232.1 hypothetical protein P1062_0201460 [Pasteurella multocida subsp. multocida P1062]MDX3892846.1 hypothetical protein [Pasteurella multocida]MDX3951600.1 hypothetical protein [Pasteurella multocida]MDY0559659.1 hypothetical protein [Pasteurella multocida]MDY0655805.1 hypothetical protein [Pasteurella multocida]